jgi:ketosteroid isomerase-like protein
MTDPRDIVRALYADFLAGRIDDAIGRLAPDVEWVEHFPFPGVSRTPEEVRAVFDAVGRTFARYDMELATFFAEGHEVAVRGRYRVAKDDARPQFESPFVHLYVVRDARVARYEGLLDTAGAQRIFGRLTLA